jgi:hypothetical protein
LFDKVIDQSAAELIPHIILPITLSPTNNDKSVLGTMNDAVFNYKANKESPSGWAEARRS